MGIFRVLHKHLYRASVVPTQMGMSPDGIPLIVQQPGPMQRLEVGTLLYDVQPDELAAFGDRLGEVSQEVADTEAMVAAAKEEAARKAALEATVQEARTAADVAAHAALVAEATAKEAIRIAALREEEARAAMGERARPVMHGRVSSHAVAEEEKASDQEDAPKPAATHRAAPASSRSSDKPS